jgi:hypothetical protein
MMEKSIGAAVAAAFLAASSGAGAACFTRPGTPNEVKAMPAPGKERNTLALSWHDTVGARERVCHDFEVTDGGGRLVQSFAGVNCRGIGANLGRDEREFGGLPPNTTRCFRIKGRTEAGTQGCVSQLWSGRVCATTASAPGPGTTKGDWGALAADGHGHWGFAVHYATEAQARAAARKGCGARRCTVRIAAQVGCYAYYESRSGGYWYGLALHSSGPTALKVARSGCEKGAPAGTCKLVKTNCRS